ncbi:MAG: DUF4229 domain-containing protein [Micrococcales bacterium]
MKNPVVIYSLLRLGTFAVALGLLWLIGFNVYLATILAAAIALSVSLLLFTKQRNAASTHIYENRNKSRDADAAVEDEL